MNRMIMIMPALFLASTAFAQAGVEGEEQTVIPPGPQPVAASVSTPTARPTTVAAVAAAVTPGVSSNPPASNAMIGDYDFGEVIRTLESSVEPLAGQLSGSFEAFALDIEDAVALMEAGRTEEAVALSSAAIDAVLSSRDGVVDPLWDAQFYLNEQIASVRSRLAESLVVDDPEAEAGRRLAANEAMLDRIANRVAETRDPSRKRRLIAHYRTVRDLARLQADTVRMSPDQRKLWSGVLRVLEQGAAAHQQVLMGSEVLFAQLDGTAMQLRDYLALLQTVEGIDGLLGSVEGGAGGLQGFVETMRSLQGRMETFSTAVSDALGGSMADLEVKVDAIQGVEAGPGIQSTAIDDELAARIGRINADGR